MYKKCFELDWFTASDYCAGGHSKEIVGGGDRRWKSRGKKWEDTGSRPTWTWHEVERKKRLLEKGVGHGTGSVKTKKGAKIFLLCPIIVVHRHLINVGMCGG